jgi:hypothetical protein
VRYALGAIDTTALFHRYRRHLDESHRGCCLTDEQIQAVIAANSFERTETPEHTEHRKEYSASLAWSYDGQVSSLAWMAAICTLVKFIGFILSLVLLLVGGVRGLRGRGAT